MKRLIYLLAIISLISCKKTNTIEVNNGNIVFANGGKLSLQEEKIKLDEKDRVDGWPIEPVFYFEKYSLVKEWNALYVIENYYGEESQSLRLREYNYNGILTHTSNFWGGPRSVAFNIPKNLIIIFGYSNIVIINSSGWILNEVAIDDHTFNGNITENGNYIYTLSFGGFNEKERKPETTIALYSLDGTLLIKEKRTEKGTYLFSIGNENINISIPQPDFPG